ncbi:MAG: DUF72 domain-containing protein [Proteobacteria bacterium]|nr:DUF72 domain-containing protein [Pseudomonadota bacterium]
MDSRIEALKRSGIFLGTSSWKYPGWKGLVYQENYKNEKAFKEESLKEYSHAFSAVGVDHTYYAFPSLQQLVAYEKATPPDFKFVFKAPEHATVFRYPRLPRYGKVAGTLNEHFLDPQHLDDHFLTPLRTLGNKTGAVVFEFSKFRTGTIESGSEFVKRLDTFLSAVRKKTEVPLGVEIRNRNWLVPDYFKVLKANEVAHVFNSWTEMPEIGEQWELCLPFDLPFSIARLLLKPGTAYQTAVDTFSPYDRLHLELTQTRKATMKLIRASLEKGKPGYVLVNNRFEGCAPKTIQALLDLLEIKQ